MMTGLVVVHLKGRQRCCKFLCFLCFEVTLKKGCIQVYRFSFSANGTVPGTIIMAAQFEPNQPQTANANYGYNQHPSTLQYSQLPAYPSGMTSQSQDQTGVATKPPEYHEVVNPRS